CPVTTPFEHGTSSISFRNISSRAMTTDNSRRVYVAWADRVHSNDPTSGMVTRDSHIMLTIGTPTKANGNSVAWASPIAVDALTGTPPLRGHQLRPSLWFASGKIYLSAAFTQQDQTVEIFHRQDVCDPGKAGCDP